MGKQALGKEASWNPRRKLPTFWLARTEALLSGGFFWPPKQGVQGGLLFLNLLALSLGCGLCMYTHTRVHSRSTLGPWTSHLLLRRGA